MSDENDERATSAARELLEERLTDCGFSFARGPGDRITMAFPGRYRDWTLLLRADDEWLHVFTNVCALPAEPGLAGEVALWMTRESAKMPLLKYSTTAHDRVVLEFEVPVAYLDDAAIYDLTMRLVGAAEADYLELLKLASGEARLAALATAFDGDAELGLDRLAGGSDDAAEERG